MVLVVRWSEAFGGEFSGGMALRCIVPLCEENSRIACCSQVLLTQEVAQSGLNEHMTPTPSTDSTHGFAYSVRDPSSWAQCRYLVRQCQEGLHEFLRTEEAVA